MRTVVILFLVCLQIKIGSSQLMVWPPNVYVAAVNGTANFLCLSRGSSITEVQWTMNGSLVNTTNLDNIRDFLELGVGKLQFIHLTKEYNNTQIGCSARLENGDYLISRNATLLVLQGLLSAVGSLILMAEDSTTISVNWTAPFTLDIIDNNLDITYCVEVANFTSSAVLSIDCGLTQPGFRYPIPDDSECFISIFTIIPVNPVGNGSINTVPFFLTKTTPVIVSIQRVASRIIEGKTVYTYSLNMSSPVCSGVVSFVDLTTSEEHMPGDLTVSKNNTRIGTFSTRDLVVNRHYTVIARASNIAGEATSRESLSTHDIGNAAIIDNTQSVEIRTTYLDYSLASGALFFFISHDSNMISAVLALGVNASLDYSLDFALPRGEYTVAVYDIEEDGTLYTGLNYPAVKTQLTVLQGAPGSFEARSTVLTCHTSASSSVISAECVYRNSSATDFLMIVKPSNFSEKHEVYTNTTTGGQTTASVMVVESGLFDVSIFAMRGGKGIVDSHVEYRGQLAVVGDAAPPTTASTTNGGSISAATTAKTTVSPGTQEPGPINPTASSQTNLIVGVVVGFVVVVALLLVTLLFVCYLKHNFETKMSATLKKVGEEPVPSDSACSRGSGSRNSGGNNGDGSGAAVALQSQTADTQLENLPRETIEPQDEEDLNVISPATPLLGGSGGDMESEAVAHQVPLQPPGEARPPPLTISSVAESAMDEPGSVGSLDLSAEATECSPRAMPPRLTTQLSQSMENSSGALNTSDLTQTTKFMYVASAKSFHFPAQDETANSQEEGKMDSGSNSAEATPPNSPGIPLQEEAGDSYEEGTEKQPTSKSETVPATTAVAKPNEGAKLKENSKSKESAKPKEDAISEEPSKFKESEENVKAKDDAKAKEGAELEGHDKPTAKGSSPVFSNVNPEEETAAKEESAETAAAVFTVDHGSRMHRQHFPQRHTVQARNAPHLPLEDKQGSPPPGGNIPPNFLVTVSPSAQVPGDEAASAVQDGTAVMTSSAQILGDEACESQDCADAGTQEVAESDGISERVILQ